MVRGILVLCTFRILGTSMGAALVAGQATHLLTSQLLTSDAGGRGSGGMRPQKRRKPDGTREAVSVVCFA